jgi:hypothetical protein
MVIPLSKIVIHLKFFRILITFGFDSNPRVSQKPPSSVFCAHGIVLRVLRSPYSLTQVIELYFVEEAQ